MDWSGRRVLVTGGCSFIGSHLVDALVGRGASVRVADDLSSGRREHLAPHLATRRVELLEVDLLAPGAAERVHDGTAIDIGTMERTRVIDAAREILRRTGVDARIETDPSQPTGPYDRVADNALARRRLDWTPRVSSGDGLDRTIAWYWAAHDRDHVRRELARRLTER